MKPPLIRHPASTAAPCSRPLALLPAMSGPLLSRRPRRRRRDAGRPAAVVERRARRSRRSSTSCAPPPTGRARTIVPPEDRIAVFDQDGTLWVEHPDVHASGLLPGSRPGRGGEEAGAEERRAVQDRAVRQPRGDRQAPDARSREDPRCDADRHDGGGVQRRSEEVDRNGQASALEAPLHRARLSADARSAAATCATTATRPTS